jgi:hypothetical protein
MASSALEMALATSPPVSICRHPHPRCPASRQYQCSRRINNIIPGDADRSNHHSPSHFLLDSSQPQDRPTLQKFPLGRSRNQARSQIKLLLKRCFSCEIETIFPQSGLFCNCLWEYCHYLSAHSVIDLIWSNERDIMTSIGISDVFSII